MIGFSSLMFALAALIYLSLGGWRLSIGHRGRGSLLLASAFGGMVAWTLGNFSGDLALSNLAEAIRNVAWIAYLRFIIRRDQALIPQAWVARLPAMLTGLMLIRAMGTLILMPSTSVSTWAILFVLGCSLAFCIGALVLLHSLYFAAHYGAAGFRLLLFVLAVLWVYDLNTYAAILLRFDVPSMLVEGRGLLALLLAPLFGIAVRRKEHWSLGLSRRVTFQSLSLVAIGGYFVLLSTIAGARPWLGDLVQGIAGTLLVITASSLTIAFLVSGRVRGTIRVFLSKHLFKHRYDYRTEWLQFNATINSGSLTGLTPEQRAIKALADIMDAAGGLLFLCGSGDRLEHVAALDWPGRSFADADIQLSDEQREAAEAESRIMISPRYTDEEDAMPFPRGLPIDGSVWLAVPLVRMGKLMGVVALGRPTIPRRLDWEDFDLLKVLGQQIATYVADAQRQAELEEARQFEEFNRRFAFIVHDIKNVVSQLSLVAANAEEHGANPRFQADMTSTLRNAAGKMTTLLSRLSLDRSQPDITLEPVDAMQLLQDVARARWAQHPVRVTAGAPLMLLADAAKLVTALDHLVQNAIEASTSEEQVVLSAYPRDGRGFISILDNGGGMSADFIRKQLFKPFASTKAAGFGIGAGEARSLVRQMGGELEVQSVEGVGTSFIITLDLSATCEETRRDR